MSTTDSDSNTPTAVANNDQSLAALHAKVDALTDIVGSLAHRQQVWEDLAKEAAPIVSDVYHVAVEELSQVDQEFTTDDIATLGRKSLRSVRNFSEALDQLSSLQGLVSVVAPLSKEMMDAAIEILETKSDHIVALLEAMKILDNIVKAFGVEDIRALGDNIVTILQTVRNLTQPDIVNFVNETLDTMRHQDAEPLGFWGMLSAMRDPQVRQGLAFMTGLLKQMSRFHPADNQSAKT